MDSIQEAEGGREGERERIHESVRECVQERVDNNTGEGVISKQTQTVCVGLRFVSGDLCWRILIQTLHLDTNTHTDRET